MAKRLVGSGKCSGIALCAAVCLLAAFNSPLPAQVLAGVDISPVAQGTADPHPIQYTWEGENNPVREPVQYYSYYYTGVVNPDATVPVGVDIDRIAIPNSEWETNKAALISQLTAFYQQSLAGGGGGGGGVAQRQVTFDENFNYVEVPQQPGAAPANREGMDPQAAAEWTFYYDQFVLWQFYVQRVLLNDRNATRAGMTEAQRRLERARRAIAEVEGVEDVDSVLNEALARGQQMAAEAEEEGTVSGFSPAGRFNPDQLYADPTSNQRFREEFILMAAQREEKAVGLYEDMLDRIEARSAERQRYEAWLDEKRAGLRDFARAWARVDSGSRVNFEDTFYLITKEPLDLVPSGARNVVVEEVVTPQDFINPDGRLKGPQFGTGE